jgi:hypothetical protein
VAGGRSPNNLFGPLADPPQPATQCKRDDMANPWATDRRQPFYPGIGLAGLVVIALGFGVTYGLPMARGTFAAPWFVHLHGATALTWVLLYIAQSVLVSTGRTSIHRRLGLSAFPVAAAIWASGIATAIWAARRDLPEMGTIATSSVAGTLTGLSLFLIIVLAALALRRRPDWHKRLVTLATIHLLWPAFFRLRHLFPMIPNPEITLALVAAYAPILIAAFRDYRRFGAIHPVWLFVAPVLFIEQSLEVAFFDQGPHRSFGAALFKLLT